MQYGLSILLSGISLGGQYALIAIGYTLVYGILRLINFAHGDVFMAAGLIMVYLSASLPLPVALPLMVVLVVALGFFIERCAYKPLRSAPRMSVMISAIGVSYLLQNFATYITGGLPQMYPAIPGLSSQVTIAGVSTKWVTVVTPVLVVVLVVGFGRVGRALAPRLQALGARVTVAARRYEQRSLAQSMGLGTERADRLPDWLCGYDLVVNTAPARVLGVEELSALKEGALVIDLASKPGGIDLRAAEQLELETIWALGLPGKVAPGSAGQAIVDTVLQILTEQEVSL